MAGRSIVETFNTHRMRPEVVQAVATGRDRELAEIMTAIRLALDNPGTNPQHLVVYGERGSGKSFLMRLVELKIQALAADRDTAVAMILLPEEQYNIRSEAQLIEALAAALSGQGERFSYAYDSRDPRTAWDEAIATLGRAMDQRFGPGRGLLIAGIENFDDLSRKLFGTGKSGKTRAAAEQRAAEERLRRLMSTPDVRLMLLVTATGTVDMDYERPMFQAFANIELTGWNSDTCIVYYNRRRALDGSPPLTDAESARARAITAFIGGNPRLAQLLGEVLATPDGHTIAATLDSLSDELADYYRRRLDDLPPAAAGLLDALIRLGEPCSQTGLAERVNQRQNQIADAFGHLTVSRVLIAEREKDGPSRLYRVRDRLFVHFYRRRYGDGSRANELARIAELLATFYTADEKAEQALRHLKAGEPGEARLYLDLRRAEIDNDSEFSLYREQDRRSREPSVLFLLAEVADNELDGLRTELRERPVDTYIYWSKTFSEAKTPLTRAAAAGLSALAASLCGLDEQAAGILHEALSAAEAEDEADAKGLLLHQLAIYTDSRLGDRDSAIKLAEQAGALADTADNTLVCMLALGEGTWAAFIRGEYAAAIETADQSVRLAADTDRPGSQAGALSSPNPVTVRGEDRDAGSSGAIGGGVGPSRQRRDPLARLFPRRHPRRRHPRRSLVRLVDADRDP